MTRQLAFDLPTKPALGREDFFISPSNAVAVAALDGWRDWPLGKLVLAGPPGSGKTHLSHVWAGEAGAARIDGKALASSNADLLAGSGAVVVDGADAMGDAGERPLFHLHNLLAERRGALLLTAQAAPSRWPVTLPDLRSRLEAASVVRIDPPDDALLLAIMVKLFADRQIDVPSNLPAYLLARTERSFAAIRDLVEVLDSEALAAGQPVTRALAARLLDKSGQADT
ncbi:MAG: DnaA/Hda family protein [Pseudomonadota bacterium]